MTSLESRPPQGTWALGLSSRFNLNTLPRHADQILIAAGIYQALFTIGSPMLSRQLIPDTYKHFTTRTKANWDSRVVGFIQAVFICFKALNVIITDPSRENSTVQSRLWGYSPATGAVQAYAAGYFLWDIYVSARYWRLFGPTAFAHAVSAFLVTMLGFRPFGNYYGVSFVLYELSTPFLNVHWMLDKFGMTGSDAQLYNGIALISSFFGCRLVWGSYQTWLLSRDMLAAWQAGPVPEALFGTYFLANATLTGLNFFWFSKMITAMRKRFSGAADSENKDSQ